MAQNNNPPPASKQGAAGSRTESDHDLVAHLEQLTGRRIKSRQDINDYVSELSVTGEKQRSKRQHLKNFLLVTLLIVAAAQYYFIDVQLQILSQPSLTVFAPVRGDSGPSRPYTLVAKEHAIQAAQQDLPVTGVQGEVVDVELLRVGRVLVKLRDGRSVTVDRWLAVKLRTLLQQRFPRRQSAA